MNSLESLRGRGRAAGWIALALAACLSAQAHARGEWIDVHVHPVVGKGATPEAVDQTAQTLLQIMDNHNIRQAVIMPLPNPAQAAVVFNEHVASIGAKHAPRLAFLGSGTLNMLLDKASRLESVPDEFRQKFEAVAEAQIARGAIGFGEIAALHVSHTPTHHFIQTPPDHPLLLLLADIAARHDVPIDLHCDPVAEDMATPGKLISPRNPPQLKGNLAAIERLLAHNRKAVIVWAHLGSHPTDALSPRLAGELLERHPNLYFSIRPFGGNEATDLVSSRGGVNRDWLPLLHAYPDRFVIGTDSFIVAHDFAGNDAPRTLSMGGSKNRDGVSTLLAALPDALARKIGYENAIRIYKLKPAGPRGAVLP